MAEGLALSIAENLIPKLTSIALSEIGLIYNCHEDLENLEDTLSIIKDVLLDAEELQEKSYFVRNRIKKLEQVLYNAEDLLDDVATEDLRRNLDTRGCMTRQVCDFFSSSNHVAFRHNMGHAVREIRDKLDQIASDISKFNFISNRVIVNTGHVGNRERDTDSFVSDVIIGREEEKNEMIEMLLGYSSTSNTDTDTTVSPIIPIVGIGGLGKTALAKLVFNDERVVNNFEPRIWVCVSVDFEKEVIVRNILRCIITDTSENLEDYNMENLQNHLREKLHGKRYLLVLDDVWNEDSERWNQLERLLMVEANGWKIMVTTRNKKVASAMGVDSPFLLNGLSDEQSLELFEKLAFKEGLEEVHRDELKEIGKKLVKMCEGVPLAIKTLGSTMRSKTSASEWESIQTNKIWSLSSENSGILSVLKLSYDQLPTHLKYCFSYCSIFPKDHQIQCEMLIQLWMAQGYVQSSEPSENLEKIGIDYVKNFLSLSFFQEVEVDDYKNITSFKMHDLIHDLAIEVAVNNYYFIAENDAKNSNVERVHHASLESGLRELPKRLLREKGTRTFFLPVASIAWERSHVTININVRQQRTIMSNFKCLRVLDLHNCGIRKVRSSIGLLMRLRYLDLSRNKELKGLSDSISNLLNLQTLKLSDCYRVEKLPKKISKLINLRYLMIDGCVRIKHMPSGIKTLVLLQRLSKFVVGKDKDKWGVHSPCGRLSELEGLNNLGGKLRIENLGLVGVDDAAATNLKEKKHLQSLALEWGDEEEIPLSTTTTTTTAELVLEGLEPHPNVKELFIDGYPGEKFPSWMTRMDNMVKITILSSDRCQQLQPLNQLPRLKFLSLYALNSLEYIQEELNQVRDGHPPPSTSSSSSSSTLLLLFFPSLEQLKLQSLPTLKGWWKRRRESLSEEEEEKYTSSSSSSLVFPQLTELTIKSCPMFTSMPLHPNIKELELTSVGKKLVRERLTTTSAEEEERKVDDYHHHQMSSSSNIISSSSSLSKLKSLHIEHVYDLKSISREVQHLTALENLILEDCPELELCGDDDGIHWQCLRSLRKLDILEIPKLVTLPVGIQHLTTLQHLTIHRCAKLKSTAREVQHLTALENLILEDCPELELSDDDDGIHWQGLGSLRKLEILNIRKLVTLPVGIQHLTTLQRLQIQLCDEFLAVPGWIGNLTQLQQLRFSYCRNLASLPQEIRCLTSLQQLEIDKCPNLTERCQKGTGEDWLKIAHIPNIKIDDDMIQGTYFFYL